MAPDEALAPCPFCGKDPKMTFTGVLPDGWWEVACSDSCVAFGMDGVREEVAPRVCARWNEHAGAAR